MKKFIFSTSNDYEEDIRLEIVEGSDILEAMGKYASIESGYSIVFSSMQEIKDYFIYIEYSISDIKELKGELVDL